MWELWPKSGGFLLPVPDRIWGISRSPRRESASPSPRHVIMLLQSVAGSVGRESTVIKAVYGFPRPSRRRLSPLRLSLTAVPTCTHWQPSPGRNAKAGREPPFLETDRHIWDWNAARSFVLPSLPAGVCSEPSGEATTVATFSHVTGCGDLTSAGGGTGSPDVSSTPPSCGDGQAPEP